MDLAEKYKTEGNELMTAQRYEEAMEKYSKAIVEFDTNAVYWCNRAAAHIHLGRYTAAIDDCQMAIALDPKYVRARERLASAYRYLEMPDKEEQVLRGEHRTRLMTIRRY